MTHNKKCYNAEQDKCASMILAIFDVFSEEQKYEKLALFVSPEYSCHEGVLQGCPLAALLFVLSMEPFVLLFQKQLIQRDLGTVAGPQLCCALDNIYLGSKKKGNRILRILIIF